MVIVTPLRLAMGDIVAIRRADDREVLWRVEKRRGGGYFMEPLVSGDRRVWSDNELHDALCNRRLRHIPFDSRGLSKNASEALSRTWEFWPEHVQQRALQRLEHVKRVDAIAPLRVGPVGDSGQAARRDRCVRAGETMEVEADRVGSLKEAYLEAASTVWAENKEVWLEDQRTASAIEAHEEEKRRKIRPSVARKTKYPIPKKPSPSTVRDWWFRWDEANGDLRALIAHDHAKGCRRPYYPQTAEGGETTYRIMAWAVDEFYKDEKRPNAKAVYTRYYVKKCEEHHLPVVSYETFRLFIKRGNCAFDVFRKRYGLRAARMRYKVYERTTLPERPLEEVEVDHCLIDLVVRHPKTKRVLGRPWLTVLIDRATRALLGCHLSFEVPSFGSLQRTLAHAFWPKDVSAIDGIEGEWPMHGIPEWLFTDNGREFRSASLRLSEAMLDFAVINLPVKQPQLKGMCERIFQTMGVQIFSLEEGSILARSDAYEPTKRAELSLAEVNHKILKWVVDTYHNEPHPTLKGKTPLEAWTEKTALYSVRPIPDFDHIVRLTGDVIRRGISNVGVHYEGFLFSDRQVLEHLRTNGGLDREWTIRVDPYNYGEIWVLDDLEGRWLSLPNTDPDISVGVSRFQHRLHTARAKAKVAKRGGKVVTNRDILEAKVEIEMEAEAVLAEGRRTGAASMAARYQTNGDLFTPLRGGGMLRSTLDPEAAPAEAEAPAPLDQESAKRKKGSKANGRSKSFNGASTPAPVAPQLERETLSNAPSPWLVVADGVSDLVDAW